MKNRKMIKVTDTNTQGSYTYLVAVCCNEEMGNLDGYCDFQFINAESQDEAVEKYNRLNNCLRNVICEVVGEAKEWFEKE